MASALSTACSSGDADAVRALLDAAAPADLEAKGLCPCAPAAAHSPPADQFGVTPLIEAVRNGHADIVQALLDKGADPTNASAQGPPESYTGDPAILELLRAKAYPYAAPPAVPYPYYAGPPDGAPFYPPQSGPETVGGGLGNLPPPDIARFIPC
ncbi:hypothetical protein C0993_006585, partial [Termitomyces sp. T159_Od127]